VVRLIVVITLVLSEDWASSAPQPCAIQDHSKMFSPGRKPLAPKTFDAVRPEMTMWEIVELLGPAQREIGSGLMILGWQSSDGRVFLIGGSSMCKPPIYARFDQGAPSNNSLERMRE